MLGLASLLGALVMGAVTDIEALRGQRDSADDGSGDNDPPQDEEARSGNGDLLDPASETAVAAPPAPGEPGSLLEALLEGGEEGDTLIGGAGDEAFAAGGGDDVVQTYAGDDSAGGGAGDDLLYGDDGDDTLWGGAGADTLLGESGDDSLFGGDGGDSLTGHVGADLLAGGSDDDELNGGPGADRVAGGEGDDAVIGGLGDDVLTGGQGQDILNGNAGDDVLSGVATDAPGRADSDAGDYLNGGAGEDIVRIGANDHATGGDGADSFALGDWIERDEDASRIGDYEATEDQIVVVYDDAATPAPELTVEPGVEDPETSEIRLDGVKMAEVADAPELTADDIVLLAHSELGLAGVGPAPAT